MVRILKMLLIVGILVCMVGGCSSVPMKNQIEVSMNPSRSHEDCFELSPSQVLHYSFKTSYPANYNNVTSSALVNFNIHYHEAEKINYVVSQDNIDGTEGKYTAEKEQFYCLMWTNIQSVPVGLSYTFSIGKE